MLLEGEESRDLWDVLREMYENGVAERESMTPENKVKSQIKDLLAAYDIQPAAKAGTFATAAGWYYSAVQGPMSVRGIPDFIGFYRGGVGGAGVFFAVEAKAPGKNPTGFQLLQIISILQAGGACFVVDGEESLAVFEEWLKR
jgi:hypothetical protein